MEQDNKPVITCHDFVEKFTIHPPRDIEPFFELDKRIDISVDRGHGCFNCNNHGNQQSLRSSPWTAVQYCHICKHINVVYFQDRMGGCHTDVVECFKEKENERKTTTPKVPQV